MTRLVDYCNRDLNAMYDALPLRGKLAIIRDRFDRWVRDNGSNECVGCNRIVAEIGGWCGQCFVSDPPATSGGGKAG